MKKPTLLAVLGIAILLPTQVDACSIPVFRYALEKWDLTRYEILVYHRGPLPADLDKRLSAWSDAPNKANIDITMVDLDSEVAPKLRKHWEREGKDAKTPWMLVRYKEAEAGDPSNWSGPCTVANFNLLLKSPTRRAIVEHLTQGASGVYILMSDDQATQTSLKAQLATLEKKIRLPEQTADGPQIRLPIPLKVSLPLLVLDRNDPEEAGFVKLLLATEEGLDKVEGPILFPIFGRGRVLCSLSGKDLTEKNLLVTTQFLCGKCSCEVKAANPGVDMLMSANWMEIFDSMFDGKSALLSNASPSAAVFGTLFDAKPAIAEANLAANSGPAMIPQVPPTPMVVETPLPDLSTGKVCCEPETPEVACGMCEFSCPIARNWHYIASGLAGIMLVGAGIWSFCLLRK